MARLPRWTLAGQAHLVLLRGLDQRPVVIDDDDRQHGLDSLREASLLSGVAIHAYALQNDRLRLLLRPVEDGSIARLMQDFGRRYVGRFNRRHGRRGTLWDGRYRATVVQPGALTLRALLFVDTEPARSGLVDEADAYRWSSAGHHVGRRTDPLLSNLAEYWQLGNTPFERELAYSRLLQEGLPAMEIQRLADACHKGWIVGDAAFMALLAAQTGRPPQPRRRGRPARQAA